MGRLRLPPPAENLHFSTCPVMSRSSLVLILIHLHGWLSVLRSRPRTRPSPMIQKKSVWVPNKADGGYLEGMIESTDGAKLSVDVGGEVKVYKEAQVCQINPPKFDCAEDMANLTFLGD